MTAAALLQDVSQAAAALQLLRPHWLWAWLALPVLAAIWQSRRRRGNVWRDAVDPHLLPHLIDARAERRGHGGLWLVLFGFALAVLALAGPSWRHSEQPLWQTGTPLVIALDLSSSVSAGDLPPSRLAQARASLAHLLAERTGGEVGLVVYADDAFTIAPLTDDARNIALFLDALQPRVMPVDGQRSDRAIAWSARLLRQADFDRGRILLLTDHADDAALGAAADAAAQGYRVSVLGLGTAAGAAYRKADGTIEQARLDGDSLRALATRGGGHYVALAGDRDGLQALDLLDAPSGAAGAARGEGGRIRLDQGYWLLLPLMLLALLAFRGRGGTAAILLLCLWLPWHPAQAADPWQRPDQVRHSRMQAAAQAYRAGEFDRAAQLYAGIDNADGHYNRGNALARAGEYPQAIEAYDRALAREPGMPDALANKRAVEAAMRRQPPAGQGADADAQPEQGDRDDEGRQQDGQGGNDRQQQGQRQRSDEAGSQRDDQPSPPEPADAQAQQAADAAQREAMQRELQQRDGDDEGRVQPARAEAETAAERERRLANEAWLQRVPDDPGGLLREKFRIEHERRRGGRVQ